MSVEPQDGTIRSLAGQEKDFNLALDARRQPGSTFTVRARDRFEGVCLTGEDLLRFA